MAGNVNVVSAAVGTRLLAWLLDAAPAAVAVMTFGGVNARALAWDAYSTLAEPGASLAGPCVKVEPK